MSPLRHCERPSVWLVVACYKTIGVLGMKLHADSPPPLARRAHHPADHDTHLSHDMVKVTASSPGKRRRRKQRRMIPRTDVFSAINP